MKLETPANIVATLQTGPMHMKHTGSVHMQRETCDTKTATQRFLSVALDINNAPSESSDQEIMNVTRRVNQQGSRKTTYRKKSK
jgi:hypothetical protein